MDVASILGAKGSGVITTTPETTIVEAVKTMKHRKVGALVVSGDGSEVVGIITERDILHGLAKFGARFLQKQVGDMMTREVMTAKLEDDVDTVMRMMTLRRCRHIPVMKKGELCGLVSIGDLVKSRLRRVEQEADQLRNYIARA